MSEEIRSKICPMRPIYSEDRENGQIRFYKCEREDCAWWNDRKKCCAVLAVSGVLERIIAK